MNMIKTPVNGMKDIEPREMEIRQFILSKIREVYSRFGFTEIETPNIEHIENLLSEQGWDNEKLIFKILKRGEKLDKAFEAGNMNEIVDSGLRYDLTVPLCRFYSNNKDKLTMPFKAMQIGNVYRADRPQKGRFRQFCQCDIDTLGEATNLGEIETLLATSTLLKEIGFDKYNFSFDINDRRILKSMTMYAGFPDCDFETVCITLDKLDKIGFDGVKKELLEKGYKEETIDKFNSLLENISAPNNSIGETHNNNAVEAINSLLSKIVGKNGADANISNNDLDLELRKICNNLIEIIETVIKNIDVKINFNPTLVRGMGYYTGPIFEIKSEKFSGSVGGGGRYDNMVSKFIGQDVPALGISIGFERIIGIYLDDDFKIPSTIKKIAYLVEKGMPIDKKADIIKKALVERNNGNIVYIAELAKNKKFQCEKLETLGYTEFETYNI
ncbi:MAG: ATP phosphoribosyltransferase regulatory subunit [Lachnospiraceae bacterium]|nr:ATP phosphoribosyltransferase regulatory subunit [Lachnospiraceae bacterium]